MDNSKMKTKDQIQRKYDFYGDKAVAISKNDHDNCEANYYAGARDALWWVLERTKWF